MNYIDLLTQEEKPILCRIITGRDFKELFKRNEQGILENTKRIQSQIIDRAASAFDCYSQC